jgi:hypothetical protein
VSKKEQPLEIIFTPTMVPYEDKLIPPEPAIKHLPEWYRTLAKFGTTNDEKNLNPINHIGSDGALVATKMCMPYFDALTSGYMYVLEDDLLVELDEQGFPTLSWQGSVLLLDKRPTLEIVLPNNTHPLHFGFRMNWFYETPPGYSVLITHPMNRFDLPFYTMSGVVESDVWGLPVFIAFFLQKGFQGVIPKGTPIMQIIPFKRDNWVMKIDDSKDTLDRHEFAAENRRSMLYGYYKKHAWRRKIFSKPGDNKVINHDDE